MEVQITLADGCTVMLVSLALNKTWKEGETACLVPSRGKKKQTKTTKKQNVSCLNILFLYRLNKLDILYL